MIIAVFQQPTKCTNDTTYLLSLSQITALTFTIGKKKTAVVLQHQSDGLRDEIQ